MKIETHRIPASGLGLEFEERPDHFTSVKELMDTGECGFVAPVGIFLQVIPMPDMFRVEGVFNTTIRQACVRCLEPFDRSLTRQFTLDYSKSIPDDLHRDNGDSVELTAQQIGMIHYEGDEIDFTDAVQEQILLAVPYQPLCSDTCKGLCARCGQNFNHGDCRCGRQDTVGPFEVLKKLKLPSE